MLMYVSTTHNDTNYVIGPNRRFQILVGMCANPCGTAIQGQHLTEPQQAADTLSPSKNQFNIEESL